MLVLTEAAAQAVKSVTATMQESETAGLRIASAVPEPVSPGALQVTTAPGPGENDHVIEAAGARIYLEPRAAAFLDDKILDARPDAQGNPRFSLGVQGNGRAYQQRSGQPGYR
jgi:iron-sulfur cluster assembly protein